VFLKCISEMSQLAEFLNKPNVMIIDCRSGGECSCGDGYKGAVNIPVGDLPGRLAECGADKSRPIVCYCGAGVRAANAASVLRQNGYTNVISAANANALRAVKPH
jgi:rhodanese-related sulfurtransferase